MKSAIVGSDNSPTSQPDVDDDKMFSKYPRCLGSTSSFKALCTDANADSSMHSKPYLAGHQKQINNKTDKRIGC